MMLDYTVIMLVIHDGHVLRSSVSIYSYTMLHHNYHQNHNNNCEFPTIQMFV